MSCHLTNHLGPCPLGIHDPSVNKQFNKKLFNPISFPCWVQGNLPYNKAMQHRADWEPYLAAGHLSYMPRVKSVQALNFFWHVQSHVHNQHCPVTAEANWLDLPMHCHLNSLGIVYQGTLAGVYRRTAASAWFRLPSVDFESVSSPRP